MTETLLPIVQKINGYLSDYILVALLIAVGLWYSIKTRFVQVRHFKEGWNSVFGSLSLRGGKQESGMSSFQALATAIAAQVGTGNIVGGHQRRNVLLARGVEEEDISVVNLSPEDEKILNVLLNKSKGIWDVAKLVALIDEIKAAGGNLKATGFTELEISLMGEDFGHIEDLLKEDFSDVGKKESDTFVATFTLPEEQHQRVNRYVEDYGKVGLAKAVMDKVKGLV